MMTRTSDSVHSRPRLRAPTGRRGAKIRVWSATGSVVEVTPLQLRAIALAMAISLAMATAAYFSLLAIIATWA